MLTITGSVGEKGKNLKQDVLAIQQALNKVKPPLSTKPLIEDGIFGEKTKAVIIEFQKKHVMLVNPDGRFDPGGKSIAKLSQKIDSSQKAIFPLRTRPAESYKTGMRAFGANRSSGKRKHAGVDLYAAKGTPIRAIKDGKVLQSYKFYLGTYALEVNHGDLLVRYCEISHAAPGIAPGVVVKRGQIIAYVGEMVFKDGTKMSMLHLEAYKGTLQGPLTIRTAVPYQRRADLIDPTSMLDNASLN